MAVNPILKIIKAKKLGVLIHDVRLKSGKSLDDCAQAMGISGDDLIAMEYGDCPPTLPELELLAYHLDVPLEHFWGSELLQIAESTNAVDPSDIIKIRQSAISELIRTGRIQAGLSVEELAEKAGIESSRLQSYELGESPIPLPELETIAQVLNSSIRDFENQEGPVGTLFSEQRSAQEFHELPQELRDFVSRPINRPYLELAVRLSELKVERLRALAEGLLEITL